MPAPQTGVASEEKLKPFKWGCIAAHALFPFLQTPWPKDFDLPGDNNLWGTHKRAWIPVEQSEPLMRTWAAINFDQKLLPANQWNKECKARASEFVSLCVPFKAAHWKRNGQHIHDASLQAEWEFVKELIEHNNMTNEDRAYAATLRDCLRNILGFDIEAYFPAH